MAAGEFSCRELSLDNIWQQYFSKDKQKIKTGEILLKPRNQKLCFFFMWGRVSFIYNFLSNDWAVLH